MPYEDALKIIKNDLDMIIEKNAHSRMTLQEYEPTIPFFPVKRTRGYFESVIRVMGHRYDKYIKVSLSEALTSQATNSDFEKFVFILQDIIVKMQKDWDWNDFNMGVVERIQIKRGASINFGQSVIIFSTLPS